MCVRICGHWSFEGYKNCF